jgi:aspartate/methionine/tyrosine aminotransferase
MNIDNFELERYFAKHETDVKYMLGASDCESLSVKDILSSKELNELQSLRLGYSESQGNILLRNEIAKDFQNVTPNQIIVAAPQECIFLTLNAILEPSNKIVVQLPCYQSLCAVSKAIGCEILPWMPKIKENQWHFDLSELENLVDSETKLIIINSPNNPTGHLFKREEFNVILDIAKKDHCYVFSDEMYRTLEFNENDRLPVGTDMYEKCVSLSGVSKTLGLGGLRIGWLSTKEESLLEKILHLKDYTTLSNSIISEFVALVALKKKGQILKRNKSIINENLKRLDNFFSKHQDIFQWYEPKAGTVSFVKTKLENVEEFCEDLIRQKGVFLMPGTKFGYDQFFRLGFGRLSLSEALRIFEEYINEKKTII